MRKPLIVGHRGAPSYEPENTLPSFEKAISLGVDYVELDVRTTKDRKLVVFHDEDLTRLTGIKARVKDLKLEELRSLRILNKARIPTLEEVLNTVGTRCGIIIEIKEKGLEKQVVELLRRRELVHDRVIIASFYHTVVKRAIEMEPRVKGMIIISCEPVDPAHLAHAAGATFIAVHHKYATEHLISNAHSGNIKVNVWTVNDPSLFRKLVTMGVDMITTDDPKNINPRTLSYL